MGFTPNLDVLEPKSGSRYSIPFTGSTRVRDLATSIPGASPGASLVTKSGKVLGPEAGLQSLGQDAESEVVLSNPLSAG